MVVGSFRCGLLRPSQGAGPTVEQDIDSAFAELGLRPGATEADVKAAWRRLVSQWHPDRNASAAAPARMQRINRAVEAIRRAGARPPPGRRGAAPRDAGAAPGPRPATAPPDAHADASNARRVNRKISLSLEEAAFGCTRVLRGKIMNACSACHGAGHRLPEAPCPQCLGTGTVRQSTWFAWAGAPAACDSCQGRGRVRPPCADCAGSGKAPALPYAVTVRFPQGVRDGDLLGVPARPGPPGQTPCTLNIRVTVRPHALLTLDPDGTLLCELPVDGFAWIANRSVEVPTLEGPLAVPLRYEQRTYRLPGRGFPRERRGPRGDQLITVVPVFPSAFSTDQQILLDQLIATAAGASDERLRDWQQRLLAWKTGGPARR